MLSIFFEKRKRGLVVQPRIDETPTQTPVVAKGDDGNYYITDEWERYFKQLNDVINDVIVSANNGAGNGVVNFVQLPAMTTAVRDSAADTKDGLVIFNSSINQVQAYYSSAWNAL